MKKMGVPYISKGKVYKVSSVMRRLKEKTLLVNPFKSELTLTNPENEVEERWRIESLVAIDRVVEQSWLMSDKMSYFTIEAKGKEKALLLAVKHEPLCKRWIKTIRNAKLYLEFAVFNKPVPASEQVVEIFNDETGHTTLYKRKAATNSTLDTPKRSSSIMDLKSNAF